MKTQELRPHEGHNTPETRGTEEISWPEKWLYYALSWPAETFILTGRSILALSLQLKLAADRLYLYSRRRPRQGEPLSILLASALLSLCMFFLSMAEYSLKVGLTCREILHDFICCTKALVKSALANKLAHLLAGVTIATALIFMGGCLGDPETGGKLSGERLSLSFTGERESGLVQQEIASKIERASSLDCALSKVETGLWRGLFSETSAGPGSILPVASALAGALNSSEDVRLAFDRDEKCAHELSFYLLYQDQIDALFQEPDARLRTRKAKELYLECKSKTIPEIYAGLLPSRAAFLESRLSFVNITGKMRNNVCLAGNSDIYFWPDLTPSALASPGVLLHIEGAPETLLNALKRELNGYAQNLSGRFKKRQSLSTETQGPSAGFPGIEISLFFGPQEKPLQIMTNYLDKARSVKWYTSDLKVESATTELTQRIEGLASSGAQVQGYHRHSQAYDENSFFLRMAELFAQGADAQAKGSSPVRFFPVETKERSSSFHLFHIETKEQTRTLIYNGCLSSSCQNYDDTLLWVIQAPLKKSSGGDKTKEIKKLLLTFFNKLEERALPVAPDAQLAPGSVVITELFWMGSFENDKSSHPTDEMLEIYNRTAAPIQIGGRQIACTSDPLGQSADMIITLPPLFTIEPGSYVTISRSRNHAFFTSDLKLSSLKLLNATRECILVDPSLPGTLWPAWSTQGHYNDPALQGTIIDKVLHYGGDPFNRYGSHHYSRSGVSNSKEAWSMERLSPDAPGELPSSWQSHYNHSLDEQSPSDYLFYTHHSAGRPSSQRPAQTLLPGEIIISEINWMGSYDEFGLSRSADEYVEFYNNTTRPIDLGRMIFGCTKDSLLLSGAPLFSFAPATSVLPGGYLTVYRKGALAYSALLGQGDPNLTSAASEESFTLANTTRQCLFVTGGAGAVHYNHPLFQGAIIDTLSDGSATFHSLKIGTNNTSAKKRLSGERLAPWLSGENPANWASSTGSFNIEPEFTGSTWGTPGGKNSWW